MIKHLSSYQKQASKWLLAVSILFSGLTFQGYFENLPPQTEETVQTEQLFSGNNVLKKNVSFQTASGFSQTQEALSLCIKSQKVALLFYNKEYKRQYKTVSENILVYFPTKQFIQFINFQNSSKEEPLPSQLG